MLLPNSAEVFELFLAVTQAGFYLVPINWHLVGPEIAYIVGDCEAKIFVSHGELSPRQPKPLRTSSTSRPRDASPSVATSPGSERTTS